MIVLEVLKPPIDYLDSTKRFNSDLYIFVSTRYKQSSVHGPYKQFMVQVRSVDTSGVVNTAWKVGPKPIGDSISIPLDGFSGMISYRVLFYDSSGIVNSGGEI